MLPQHIRKTFCGGLFILTLCCILAACDGFGTANVSLDFDSASAQYVKVDSGKRIRFSLAANAGGDERLWFYFRVHSSTPISPQFVIENASEAHQHNWDVVRPVFSSDGKRWVKTEPDGAELETSLFSRLIAKLQGRRPGFRFQSPITASDFWVAYSYPYSNQELSRFLASIETDPRVNFSSLGQSAQGRPIRKIDIAASPGNQATDLQDIWIICREHPGETPAAFVLEGLVDAILDKSADSDLLSSFRFHIVPMLNVDGVAEGNYYRNTEGIDIAQDWKIFQSVETRALHEAMHENLESLKVALVVNLHSANAPRSHFFLKTPPDRLPVKLAEIQDRLIESASAAHAQLQTTETVELWDFPEITGNYLNEHYGVYCLYLESNYSIGADGSVVTQDSLRDLGAALYQTIAAILVET